ncbi:MAG TPA: ribosome assembly RNA-binding protein YhbY [Patescibacteria group bacterium]|nr:ribosome assembly RNA-binding protein YhbY [Patescibacteria group bacterium]
MTEQLSGKQKRFLRAQGSVLDPVVQIGKGGIAATVVDSANGVLKARELIKVRVLPNCAEEPADVIAELAEATGAHLVQVIGRNGLLFRQNEENPRISLP